MIDDLNKRIEDVRREFDEDTRGNVGSKEFNLVREKYLGRKKGRLADLMKVLKDVAPEHRPDAGKLINDLKNELEVKIQAFEAGMSDRRDVRVDCSLPAFDTPLGYPHLISSIRSQVEDIFLAMGYLIAEGPEVETEYYNFSALNFKEHHPARDEQDTFFLDGLPETLLRTHTSPVQIRYMQSHTPPIKIISPGKVFRKDEPDATHTPVFTQVEGLLVDRDIHFSHLKGTLEVFARSFFGEDVNLRLRPSYFPFTEPSAEVDISCFLCGGEGPDCRICKGTGWLEILGSGMVHPRVLQNCGIDPEVYSGFAFGMGVERIAMLKFGINDLRMFYDNDIRFLRQFGRP